MDKAQQLHFRELLLQEKSRILEEIRAMRNSGLDLEMRDSVGELSTLDNHSSDLADVIFERSKDLALADNEKMLLLEIEEALAKMDAGTYGICDICGKAINPERLEAIPYANLCVDCERKMEGMAQTGARPLEEEVLAPPFHRTFLDAADQTGFDGEDSWQAVARYGNANSPQDVPSSDQSFGHDVYIDGDNAENLGAVEAVDLISQAEYENQLPDAMGNDIPGEPSHRRDSVRRAIKKRKKEGR